MTKILSNGVGGNDLWKFGKNFGEGQPLTRDRKGVWFLAPFFLGRWRLPRQNFSQTCTSEPVCRLGNDQLLIILTYELSHEPA